MTPQRRAELEAIRRQAEPAIQRCKAILAAARRLGVDPMQPTPKPARERQPGEDDA